MGRAGRNVPGFRGWEKESLRYELVRVHRGIQLRGRRKHIFLETIFSLRWITCFRGGVCKWGWDIPKVATSSSVAPGLGEVLERCLHCCWAVPMACVTLAVLAGAASVSAQSKSSISGIKGEVGTCRPFSPRAFLLA